MTNWEYLTQTIDTMKMKKGWQKSLDDSIATLGQQGWELVSSTPMTGALSGLGTSGGMTSAILLIFKRQMR